MGLFAVSMNGNPNYGPVGLEDLPSRARRLLPRYRGSSTAAPKVLGRRERETRFRAHGTNPNAGNDISQRDESHRESVDWFAPGVMRHGGPDILAERVLEPTLRGENFLKTASSPRGHGRGSGDFLST